MYHAALTRVSQNAKLGPIGATMTESATCPPECPFNRNGCYAQHGNVRLHWKALDERQRGKPWDDFCADIAALPKGFTLRYNVAGDLPGAGGKIDAPALRKLVTANAARGGKNGWTYSHYSPFVLGNAAAIRHANANGLTVNLSANNLKHADQLADLDLGPVVVALPAAVGVQAKTDKRARRLRTPQGRPVLVCPAEYADTTCARCLLCLRRDRKVIVGFSAHGSGKRKADAIASIQTEYI